MKKLFSLILAAILICAFLPTMTAAADNVVYVKDGGMGDGSSAESPVGTLVDAYNMLESAKDGIIVVCGKVSFSYFNHLTVGGTDRDKHTLVTSVYDGVDYREKGAKISWGVTWCLTGDTAFDNVNIEMTAKNGYIICRNFDLTFGEGLKMKTHPNTTGLSSGDSFCIIGNTSQNQSYPNRETEEKTTVTLLNGEKMYITPYDQNAYYGNKNDVEVIIGGNAKVGVAMTCTYGTTMASNGALTYTVKDNAEVVTICGYNKPQTVESLTVNWIGGTISYSSVRQYSTNASSAAGASVTFTKGATLNSSRTVEALPNYNEIALDYDNVGDGEPAPAKTEAPITTPPATDAPITDAPITDAPITDAPETDAPITDAPETDGQETDAPAEDAPSAVEEGGCGSSVNVSAALMLSFACVCLLRKKCKIGA